ncbi:hypothetical protein CSUI_010436, partial [Cystoisospora suis]
MYESQEIDRYLRSLLIKRDRLIYFKPSCKLRSIAYAIPVCLVSLLSSVYTVYRHAPDSISHPFTTSKDKTTHRHIQRERKKTARYI